MKYFENGKTRGCFHEFVQGKWDEEALIFWSADSLYLHDDVVIDLDLTSRLFKAAGVVFNNYGITKITLSDWNALVKQANEAGGEVLELIEELRPWAEDNFQKNEVFTILGI